MRSEDLHREHERLNAVLWPDITRPVYLYVGSRNGYTRGVVAHTRAAFLGQTRSLILREHHKSYTFVGLVQPVSLSVKRVVDILRWRARNRESMFRDWLYGQIEEHKETLGRLPQGFTEHPPTTPKMRGELRHWYDEERPIFRGPEPGPCGPRRRKLYSEWLRRTTPPLPSPDSIRPSRAPVAPRDAEVFVLEAHGHEGSLGLSTFLPQVHGTTELPFFFFTTMAPHPDPELLAELTTFYAEQRTGAAAKRSQLDADTERRRQERQAQMFRELEDLFQ